MIDDPRNRPDVPDNDVDEPIINQDDDGLLDDEREEAEDEQNRHGRPASSDAGLACVPERRRN